MAFEEIDLSLGLPPDELDRLIGDRDYKLFLNPRNELYREMNMKEKPPTRQRALKLMSENPNLVRRPILVKDEEVVPGFDERRFQELVAATN